MTSKGFTLIELLIVVAIIAILAAIAVPNFLEAQVRAKVSRCRADMRTLKTANEAYRVDYNHYAPDTYELRDGGVIGVSEPVEANAGIVYARLTTPIAYISSPPKDGFMSSGVLVGGDSTLIRKMEYHPYYIYRGAGFRLYAAANRPDTDVEDWIGEYIFVSPGPDKSYNSGEFAMHRDYYNAGRHLEYDPTNGTTSWGDIVTWGP